MTANRFRTARPASGFGATIELMGRNLRRLWLRLTIRRPRRYAIQLHNLSDAVLRDIGLDRAAIGWRVGGQSCPSWIDRHN